MNRLPQILSYTIANEVFANEDEYFIDYLI